MTQIDDILEQAKSMNPETYTAILAREVEKLREEARFAALEAQAAAQAGGVVPELAEALECIRDKCGQEPCRDDEQTEWMRSIIGIIDGAFASYHASHAAIATQASAQGVMPDPTGFAFPVTKRGAQRKADVFAGIAWARQHTQSIPAPRVLKEGERAVLAREEVRNFAQAMEMTLQKHDHKGGWQNETWRFLWGKLREEFVEVKVEMMPLLDEQFMGLPTGMPDFAKLASEAVDLGNMAMMIHDNATRALRTQPTEGGA